MASAKYRGRIYDAIEKYPNHPNVIGREKEFEIFDAKKAVNRFLPRNNIVGLLLGCQVI